MTCVPCTYSPEQGGVFSQTSFLDIPPSAPLSGIPTAARSSESESKTDGSPECTCMKVTSSCLIHPSGKAEWIAFMRASLARILAPLEQERASMASEADFIAKSSGSHASFVRDMSSWKIAQQSLFGGSEQSSPTWCRSGMIADGQYWPLPTWVRPVSVSDGGALHHVPTPKANDSKKGSRCQPTLQNGLAGWVLTNMLPSPKARDWRAAGGARRNSPDLPTVVGGALNPPWVEWLMGWPIGFSESKPLATARSRSAQRQRGRSSVDHE